MRWKVDSPTAGPALDSVYKPGSPGAAWTEDEIETTRYRILQVLLEKFTCAIDKKYKGNAS